MCEPEGTTAIDGMYPGIQKSGQVKKKKFRCIISMYMYNHNNTLKPSKTCKSRRNCRNAALSITEEHAVGPDVKGSLFSLGSVFAHLLCGEPTLATSVEIDLVCALREASLPSISNSIEQDHDRERKVGREEILRYGPGVGVHATNGPDSLSDIRLVVEM